MKQYSYMVGGLDTKWKPEDEQIQLNKFGAMGWELVSVVTRSNPEGVTCCYYYFRREMRSEKIHLGG